MKEIEMTVCQGIGDIIWTYQQAYNHVDAIRYLVMSCPGNSFHLATRATEFIRSLHKVSSVVTIVRPEFEYHQLAQGRFDLRAVLARGSGLYSCNNLLENGVRIEDHCPSLSTLEQVSIPTVPVNVPDKYVVLYIAAGTIFPHVVKNVGIWNIKQWGELVRGFYNRLKAPLPLIIVGAEYDREAVAELQKEIGDVAFIKCLLGKPMTEVSYVLKHASYYLGYQSGLSMIADHLGTPQLWMCFPCYPKMSHSWPRKATIEDGRYQTAIFTRKPEDVLEILSTYNVFSRIRDGSFASG